MQQTTEHWIQQSVELIGDLHIWQMYQVTKHTFSTYKIIYFKMDMAAIFDSWINLNN